MAGPVREDWDVAANWLARVERYAAQAENSAGLAVKAASKGNREEAFHHAEWAWAIEFMTGWPIRRGDGAAWKARNNPWMRRIARMRASELKVRSAFFKGSESHPNVE